MQPMLTFYLDDDDDGVVELLNHQLSSEESSDAEFCKKDSRENGDYIEQCLGGDYDNGDCIGMTMTA